MKIAPRMGGAGQTILEKQRSYDCAVIVHLIGSNRQYQTENPASVDRISHNKYN